MDSKRSRKKKNTRQMYEKYKDVPGSDIMYYLAIKSCVLPPIPHVEDKMAIFDYLTRYAAGDKRPFTNAVPTSQDTIVGSSVSMDEGEAVQTEPGATSDRVVKGTAKKTRNNSGPKPIHDEQKNGAKKDENKSPKKALTSPKKIGTRNQAMPNRLRQNLVALNLTET